LASQNIYVIHTPFFLSQIKKLTFFFLSSELMMKPNISTFSETHIKEAKKQPFNPKRKIHGFMQHLHLPLIFFQLFITISSTNPTPDEKLTKNR